MNPAIGLVVALNAEASALIGPGPWQHAEACLFRHSRLTDDTHLIVARSGMGPENASMASQWLIREGVTALAVSGVSGGLAPYLMAGDLILANLVSEEKGRQCKRIWEGDSTFVDMAYAGLMDRGITAYRGPVITVPRPVLSAGDKHALFLKSKALAVDMESAFVAAAAGNAGLPFFAFRAVCDAAGRSVSDGLFDCINQKGRVRLSSLFRRLLLRPTLVSDLLRMNRDFGAALTGLGRAWHMAVRDVLPSLVSPIDAPGM